MNLLLIGVGGAIGAICRYLMGTTIQSLLKDNTFPFGTMSVNILGCFLIGYIMGLVEYRGVVGNEGRLFLVVGVLGGFTTFSSFGYETMELIKAGDIAPALANVVVQCGVGVVMVWLGNLLSR